MTGQVGSRIRQPGDRAAVPAPRRTGATATSRAGRPRTAGRPMPEMPPAGYAPYRLWGRRPAPAGWLARLVALLSGRWHHLLYLGITCRAGFVRWAEHSDAQRWAHDVAVAERDDSIVWPTLHDAVVTRAGRIVLVLDDTQDEGVRPARPDELLLAGRPVLFRGDLVDAYQVRPEGVPALTYGQWIEGARTGERRMVHAEAPIHNVEHNEGNPRAANRRTRILPRHLAMWRRQAYALAAGWLFVAGLLVTLAYDGGGVVAVVLAVPSAVGASSTLVLLAQLARLTSRGRVNVALQRRRVHRPRW